MQWTVTENTALTASVFRMTLTGDTRAITKPGQFVQVQVPGFYLRRPLSVFDWQSAENGSVTLVYKAIGLGTEALARVAAGSRLDVLAGLGNGFNLEDPHAAKQAQKPLLIGGGIGVPPLYGLCKRLLAQGKTPTAILGFNTASDIILRDAFEALAVPTLLSTADGSQGVKGFVTDAAALAGPFDYVYTCGPEPMLKAVYELCASRGVSGQFSFEERMACGFGACMGCSCRTKYGSKRICKDGPVLVWEEIVW
ncbi:MAG TPA: dihydroorotate dehydrogenase electron transfer subunit [Candidatus Limiplasma sp.]|nr:dihydroorotate dehydrogenase electron transfer subunit [Candidatus Limiplasma sp.]HPS80921.1 dihydroorotate dehydrogenase electron transfer subunit [Candidatus Limiplasma sp.]